MVEYADLPTVMAVAAAVRAAAIEGVDEIVPAARTVLVRYRTTEPPALRDLLMAPAPPVGDSGRLVEIVVRYDGPDLEAVAATTGLSVADVIRLHSGTDYTAAFCGFTPGFAYLAGLPPQLHLPRRPTPRTVVPARSVAIGSEFTGVYPTASPGGWHLLGTAQATMFDLDRQPPALVVPGDRVRFVAG